MHRLGQLGRLRPLCAQAARNCTLLSISICFINSSWPGKPVGILARLFNSSHAPAEDSQEPTCKYLSSLWIGRVGQSDSRRRRRRQRRRRQIRYLIRRVKLGGQLASVGLIGMLRTRHKTHLAGRAEDDDSRRRAQVAASSPRAMPAFLVRLLFGKMEWKMAGRRSGGRRSASELSRAESSRVELH